MAERIIQIDSVDSYNKLYGWETLHPLVTVVNHANPMASDLNHSRLNYGLYALFLKQGDGCSDTLRTREVRLSGGHCGEFQARSGG